MTSSCAQREESCDLTPSHLSGPVWAIDDTLDGPFELDSTTLKLGLYSPWPRPIHVRIHEFLPNLSTSSHPLLNYLPHLPLPPSFVCLLYFILLFLFHR